MLEEILLKPIFTDIDPNLKTLSIAKDVVIKKDGVEIARKRERRAFVPGEIEQVKEYINSNNSPEIQYLQNIWTDEVIQNYKNSINNPVNNLN